ncbi:MAG: glycosyltransferase, partial [Anaerolineae bacterium]
RKFWTTLRIRNAKEWLKNGGISRLAVYKAYAKKHGVSFSKIATPYMWLLPFTFKSLPIVTSVPQELDLPHDKPANFHYLGPIIDINRPEPAADADELNELEKILNSPQIQSKEKHLIYASTSSIFEPDIPFFKKLIRALELKPECELVLALGKKLKKEKLGKLPSNVHAFNWVPQLRMLKQADVAITHAGINTVNECLHFKVPMLVYSGAHIDQNGTAARIGYHNLGIVGSKAADGPEQIAAYIERLIHDESIKNSIEKMHEAIAKYETENRVTTIIDQLLKNNTRSGDSQN